ncbi:MAG: hypothetical protein Q9190_005527 [Brigantiaea leucoxantha]
MGDTPTLELVRFDSTANAPQPFINRTDLQVAYDTRPELLYTRSPPEAVAPETIDERSEAPKADHKVPKIQYCGLSKRYWLAFTCLIVVSAIGIGVGVGVGLNERRQRAARPSSSSAPSPMFILNDTSIATAIESNGDRHLLFQDPAGAIRQAIYSARLGRWINNLGVIVASNARNHSPLSAIFAGDQYANSFTTPLVSESLLLFYVNITDNIECKTFVLGSWTDIDVRPNSLSRYLVAPNSRHLSAVNANNTIEQSDIYLNDVRLVFENQIGNMTALHGTQYNRSYGRYTWEWEDMSTNIYNGLPEVQYNAPFSCSESDGDGFYKEWLLTFVDTAAGTNGVGAESYGVITRLFIEVTNSSDLRVKPFEHTLGLSNVLLDRAIERSDLAVIGETFAVWVNDSKPVFVEFENFEPAPIPNASFPYTRLAAVSGDSTFLYHQLDGSTFAEEQWIVTHNLWLDTVKITIQF